MFELIDEALAEFGASAGPGKSLTAIAERITRPQIRTLAAIADGRSLAEAARLGISQTSLHRAARELERSLGKPLFRNGVNGMSTTPGGGELARKLSLAMREVEWGVEEMRVAAGERGGELRVGAMPLAGSFLLAPVLNDLMKCFPQARLQVRTGDTNHLIKQLRLGEVDFVVGMIPGFIDPAEIEQEALLRSGYVLVARRNHPLTKKAEITAADLAGYDWIAPDHRATRRTAFDRLFATMPKVPPTNIEASSLSTIRLLLCGSDRLTLLTQFEFEHEKRSCALTRLPYGPIEPTHSVGVTRRANWLPTALHTKFLELIRTHAAAVAGTEVRRGRAA
jgi:DNA-binding transcriptional LysR family regulator